MLPQTGCTAFDADFAEIQHLAGQTVESETALTLALQALYAKIVGVNLSAYDVEELRAEAPLVLKSMYQLRLDLRERLKDWEARGLVSAEAEKALRSVFRAIRYATDMLGELAIGYDQMEAGEKILPAFTGTDINTLMHPHFEVPEGRIPFQSGDVIIVRGLRHNSAAIARIGDVDSQFSHAAIIHIDAKGRHRVLEALIEEGATISNLDYTLEHGLGRAVLFRHRDSDVAARAAGIEVTGAYTNDRIQDLIAKTDPHVIWVPSLWPETYCYTLSIALTSGCAVAAFDIGAQAARLRRLQTGTLIPLDDAFRPAVLLPQLQEAAGFGEMESAEVA